MRMKHIVSEKTFTITQIFRNDTGLFRVLYFDPEANRWRTESIHFFVPAED